jgi:hypothetical protein
VTAGGNDTGNPWARAISMPGMDYWIGSWVDSTAGRNCGTGTARAGTTSANAGLVRMPEKMSEAFVWHRKHDDLHAAREQKRKEKEGRKKKDPAQEARKRRKKSAKRKRAKKLHGDMVDYTIPSRQTAG